MGNPQFELGGKPRLSHILVTKRGAALVQVIFILNDSSSNVAVPPIVSINPIGGAPPFAPVICSTKCRKYYCIIINIWGLYYTRTGRIIIAV